MTDTTRATDPWCQAWLGREETLRETVSPAAVAALAATLEQAHTPIEGDELPPGWQWLLFNPVAPRSALGEDGHPRRTAQSFLPPIALPRRMWAGSRLRYLAPLVVGGPAERTSRIARIAPKEGRSGRMCFVTVEHRTSRDGQDCIVEEQDIVYREAATGPSPEPAQEAPPTSRWQEPFRPDPVLLFRYSALTFNGHRIHYDRPYAREVEHYRDLVVHGPLLATLLQGFVQRCLPGRRLVGFEFKGVAPLCVDQAASLHADLDGPDTLQLRSVAEGRGSTLQATARFSSGEQVDG